ncbi:MAG TPA: copper resistance CopC family protein [Terrimesophilobacter sp.]|nr:copper resistance CopC family protein [Terrimesophilobacter sp.]
MRNLTRQIALAGFVATVAVLAAASPAFAHNFYVSSTPSENEVLTTLPDEFIVTTNDNLLDLGGAGGGFVMQVVGPDGLYYGDGCVTVSGPSVSMTAAAGPAGDYTLTWQAISADGHTVSGEIHYRWEPAAGAETSTVGTASPPVCGEATEPEPAASEPGAAPPDADAPDAGAAADDSVTDALWIGGAVLAVAIAVVATLLLLRRKPTDA